MQGLSLEAWAPNPYAERHLFLTWKKDFLFTLNYFFKFIWCSLVILILMILLLFLSILFIYVPKSILRTISDV